MALQRGVDPVETVGQGAGDVEFDWCEGCERLFFDRGELTALSGFSESPGEF